MSKKDLNVAMVRATMIEQLGEFNRLAAEAAKMADRKDARDRAVWLHTFIKKIFD